jgi:hypothetical protein
VLGPVQPLPGGALLVLAPVSLPLHRTMALLVPVSLHQADVVAQPLFLPSLFEISIQQIIGSPSDIERIGLLLSFFVCFVEQILYASSFGDWTTRSYPPADPVENKETYLIKCGRKAYFERSSSGRSAYLLSSPTIRQPQRMRPK